jgi:hypothetical protein
MTQPLHTTSSTANIQVSGTGAASATPSTGGWSSLSAKRTTSFTSIHQEVSQTISYSPIQAYTTSPTNEGSGEGGRPGDIGGGYTGEIIPEPIGDMLLPLLAMAAAYMIVKLFRNHKTSHTL